MSAFSPALPLEEADLVEDAEDGVGVDAAQREVVVGVAAVVEVEAAQHVLAEQPGHDLLDVLALVVVAGVHQHLGVRAGALAQHVGHAPIGDVGGVKGRFEGLVFDQHAHVAAHLGVDHAQPLVKPLLAGADGACAGVAGPIGEPQREVAGAALFLDLDAVQNVRHGVAAHFGVGVAQRAVGVALILEHVGVDGADADAVLFGAGVDALDVGHAVGIVPQNVDGDGGAAAGDLMDLSGICYLFGSCGGRGGLDKLAKPGPRIGETPGREFYGKRV